MRILAAVLGLCILLAGCEVNRGDADGNGDGDPGQLVFSVSGVITGLSGTVLLQNNGGDSVPRTVNGAFTFPRLSADGDDYNATVAAHPAGQICTVTNGSGIVSGAPIEDIAIDCVVSAGASPPVYSIGGTITGLNGTVQLRNNGVDILSRSINGSYNFATRLTDGSGYSIGVAAQPIGQTCSVVNGVGNIDGANIADVIVTCVNNDGSPPAPTYSIGGTITGLDGTVVLRNNGSDTLSRSSNGNFDFPLRLDDDVDYSVTVATQPVGQICAVTNGAGTVDGSDVTNVAVSCTDTAGARLSDLELSSGELDQAFQTNQFSYTSTQEFPVASIRVTATTEDDAATMTVNGVAVISGEASQLILLPEGAETLITIDVTKADGSFTLSHTIAVIREPGAGFAQQAYIKASNAEANDQFGYAVALSGNGDTLAVSSWNEDSNATGIDGDETDNSAANSGAVYVFVRGEEGWSQQAYVKASNTRSTDQFGYSLALSGDGNTLAVGAVNEDSNATGIDGNQTNNLALNSGAVYVYTRTDEVWDPQPTYVKASNTRARDRFGSSVSLSDDGNTLAVGAPNESSGPMDLEEDVANSGAVYVFTRSAEIWSQRDYVKASNALVFDHSIYANNLFGSTVALSGDGGTLAVGASGEGSNATGIDGEVNGAAPNSGAVYIFVREDDSWSRQAYVKASNTDVDDQFGSSIALSGNGDTLVVGAWGEDGGAVGINGDQTINTALDSGAVYAFVRIDGIWSQQAYIKPSNSERGDQFGWRISLSAAGDTLAVGAWGEDSIATGTGAGQGNNAAANSGAVYIFNRIDGIWIELSYVKASNTGVSDQFGYSVALARDGGMLAVGSNQEDSSAIGINGDQGNNSATDSGAVYVYRLPQPE